MYIKRKCCVRTRCCKTFHGRETTTARVCDNIINRLGTVTQGEMSALVTVEGVSVRRALASAVAMLLAQMCPNCHSRRRQDSRLNRLHLAFLRRISKKRARSCMELMEAVGFLWPALRLDGLGDLTL